ncbi:11435091, partial [Symbiodinium sp. KB8]
ETGDEPLDLLSPTAVRHVVGTDPAKLAQWKRTASASSAASSATAAEDGSLAMGDGISLDADGRVRIEFGAGDGSDASGRPSHHRERKPGKKVAGGAMGAAAAAASAHANSQGWDLKRPGQRGNRSAAAAAAGEAGRYTGAAFRSKKAKGDVQRKGSKFEPFAYVALDPRAMSGRGGAKSVARFHNVTASTMKRGSGKRGRSVAKIAAAALTKEERSKRKRSR